MKTFSQLISEVAQPRGEDEKHFKDKHIVTKKKHPVAPDEVFTGGIKKAPKRLADYDKDEDELVYEGSVFDVPTAEGGEHDEEESHKKYKRGNKSTPLRRESKMDPVGQEDDDIDNDGDVDSSDKYLHNRRRAIGKATKKEEVELDEAAHGKYTFITGPRMKGMGEGKPSHVVSKKSKMSKIGIPHHDDPGEYGHTVRATVKNNETGEITHHHVYQSDTDRGSDKAIVSTRDVGTPRAKQREHEKALHNYLSGKKASSLKEEADQIDEISRDTARSYIRKAMAHKTTGETQKKDRSSSVNLAGKKAYGIGGKARVSATESVDEALKPTTKMGTWIKDFQKSDAPQFKGKSQEKRRQMAIAAKYGAEREVGMREESDLEEKLVGGQNKLDHNKNGKIDAHDFHLMRKKKMKEEAEQLDELSPNTLRSYAAKSYNQANTLAKQSLSDQPKSVQKASAAAFKRRSAGIKATARRLGSDEMKKIHKDVVGESAEQLDELSPNTLHSYIKKAAADLDNTSHQAGGTVDRMTRKRLMKQTGKRLAGITGASGRLADKANADMYEEVDLDESWSDGISSRNAHMHARAAAQYRNKAKDSASMAKRHDEGSPEHSKHMATYHSAMAKSIKSSYHAGDYGSVNTAKKDHKAEMSRAKEYKSKMSEEVDLDESNDARVQRSLSAHRIKQAAKVKAGIPLRRPGEGLAAYVTRKAKAQAKMQKEEAELDEASVYRVQARDTDTYKVTHHDILAKSKAHAVRIAKEKHSGPNIQIHNNPTKLDEVTRTALKKTVSYIGPDGKSHSRNVPIKNVGRDDYGQEKIRTNESINEVFNQGSIKLNNGSSIILKKEDADVLNRMFKSLSSSNRKRMEEIVMRDKSGFNEILSFAKEAL